MGLSSSVSLSPISLAHRPTPIHTDPSRMDTDEDGVTDYIELQGWDVIVIHERRGEVMEDRCKYGVWSLPVRFDSEGDGASDEIEWKFHGNPDSSDSDKDGIPDSEESGPNLTMVEGTPPEILDKKGKDKSSGKYSGAYIKTPQRKSSPMDPLLLAGLQSSLIGQVGNIRRGDHDGCQ